MIRISAADKHFLNQIKDHANIRFPLGKINGVADKASLLVQVSK